MFNTVLLYSPELTWRDMQHLIVRTASRVSNDRDSQWIENGAGHEFHPKLGFGVLGKFLNSASEFSVSSLTRLRSTWLFLLGLSYFGRLGSH